MFNEDFVMDANWYNSMCDGEKEHECGISIQTFDNPGWLVKIDLSYTGLESPDLFENSEKEVDDWLYCKKEKKNL